MIYLIAMLIERSITEVQRRGVTSVPRSCEIEQHNGRVFSVTLSKWIVFLDTQSGEPVIYHALPLAVWSA